MSKKLKITGISILAFLLVAAIILMGLFIPRVGKKRIEIWSSGQEFNINTIEKVEKEVGKDFKILLMTDIQLWTNLGDNKKVFKLMDKLVEETKPNLIVLPGDNVSGITTAMLTKQLVKKMDSYKIPWAPVFGNHDSEGNATLTWQADRFEKSEYCLFKRGPSNLYGVGNYVVNITENQKVVESLFLFDNGRYMKYKNEKGNGQEVYMGYEQIAWYKWNVQGIVKNQGTVVPSMTFSHFAIPEFKMAINQFAVKASDNRYYVPSELGYGSCSYLPGVSPVNSGFFETAKELKSTTHIFSGHDHENDASIDYQGVRFTYGLKTGCSPRYWNDAKQYGGTVVTIGESRTVESVVIK